MLSIEQCRQELNNNGDKHTDEEIIQIRNFFTEMSILICKTIKAENNEKSNYLRKGIDR